MESKLVQYSGRPPPQWPTQTFLTVNDLDRVRTRLAAGGAIIAISSKFRSHTCLDCDLRDVEGNGLAGLGALYRSYGHMFWMHNLLRVDIEVARDFERLVAAVHRSGASECRKVALIQPSGFA